MAQRDEPERIEIELTSHEPAASRPARVRDDAEVAEPVDAGDGAVEVERRRLAIAGAMIGLVALLLGFVLGRAGSTGDLAGSGATVSPERTEAPSTTVDESLATIGTPAPTTTERPRRTTTTTEVPEPQVGSIAIDRAVAGQAMEVVALRGRGELVVVDVASGSTVTYDTGQLNYGSPVTILAGDDWALLPDFDGGGDSTLVFDDGTQQQVDTGPAWQLMMADGTDVFWKFDERSDTPTIARETRLDGTPTGVEVDLPVRPIAADPLGGLVVSSANGVYRVDSAGPQRLTTGELIAVGRRRMLVRECDEVLNCSYVVVERASGERRVLDVTGLDRGEHFNPQNWYPFVSRFDADETRLLVAVWQTFGEGPPTRGALDLETGEFTEIAVADSFTDLQWSADGRSVLWLDGTLKVRNLDTGQSATFSEDLGPLVAFAIRSTG